MNSGITLHLRVPYGSNSHHMAEALFKAFAHALKIAVQKNATGETLSTKEFSDDNFPAIDIKTAAASDFTRAI